MDRSGILWSHNDDRMPVLYGLDTLGNLVRTIHLNHPNKGWEDLTIDDQGNLYIGAFGNNNNDRKDLSILKVGNPDEISETVVNGEVIEFVYEDQSAFPPPESQRNYDADALISSGDSLYVITKNRTNPFTGYVRIYRLPKYAGKYTAVLHDSLFLGDGPMMANWVTGADLSPDGKTLVLLSHDSMWIVTDYNGRRFSTGTITKISFEHLSHKAGICFGPGNELYIVDELEFRILGGKLYTFDLESDPSRADGIGGGDNN